MNSKICVATTSPYMADIFCALFDRPKNEITVAHDSIDLQTEIRSHHPDIVFMENSFNGCSTESFINWLVKDNRGLKISVWTTCDMLPVAGARFMMAGADSFIDLRRQGKEGNKLMEKVLRGDYDCPPDVKAAMAKVNYSTDFTTAPTGKERIVIHCTIFGDSIATIAKKMGIEVRTVKYHKENIHKKCGGSSLFVLLQYAIYHSVVSVEEFLEALNDSTKQER